MYIYVVFDYKYSMESFILKLVIQNHISNSLFSESLQKKLSYIANLRYALLETIEQMLETMVKLHASLKETY